ANPHFCKSALSRYTQWDFIAMVERHGIDYEERKHGQLFCAHSAKDILAMLLEECELAGVVIKTHCQIGEIKPLGVQSQKVQLQKDQSQKDQSQKAKSLAVKEAGASRYSLTLQTEVQKEKQQGDLHRVSNRESLECESLVVATGALSIPRLGGSGLGYEIARQFGLALTQRQAGLVPFMFSDAIKPLCERLSGIALEVEVSCNGQAFTESLLLTHRGMSGPVILQISNYWHPGDEITIKLLPDINTEQWLIEAKSQHGKSSLKTLLNHKLPKALVNELALLWWPELIDVPLAEFSDKRLLALGEKLNCWSLKPSATEGYRTAEVTLGGVDTDGISSKTMAAKNQPGLYFIGEVLDVTGHLGGFNFQWAWSSGYSAGMVV
ncbi:MAG: NAD(P)/FAD-dependent oxidoreductase, partial [Porticoccaceae bacterium]|nr:NAD(P)/FAD-dependent oxidoreductase [Porticoccaceae bacterium]